jgi:hypothetical protein
MKYTIEGVPPEVIALIRAIVEANGGTLVEVPAPKKPAKKEQSQDETH